MSKATIDARKEVLEDLEAFVAHILEDAKEACSHCNLVVRHTPYITFMLENMQLKNIKHS